MPELPEVETVRRGLIPALQGNIIENIKVLRRDLRGGVPEDFEKSLVGRRIEAIQRRGKYLILKPDEGFVWIMHLGMSGQTKIIAANENYELVKHDHIVITMDNGVRFIFHDPRRFGGSTLAKTNDWQSEKPFCLMGPEPLGNDFNGPALAERLKGKTVSIKAALLDQRVVAGVGNIYACEALYRSGISPQRKAGSVKGNRAENLAIAIRSVLNDAIESGGSSLRDYHHTDGSMGYFQHSFAVYDREGQSCHDCVCDFEKSGGIKRIVQNGRSTFYCGIKQR